MRPIPYTLIKPESNALRKDGLKMKKQKFYNLEIAVKNDGSYDLSKPVFITEYGNDHDALIMLTQHLGYDCLFFGRETLCGAIRTLLKENVNIIMFGKHRIEWQDGRKVAEAKM